MHATLTENPAATAERNQRILIIDDNTSIHEDVRKILGVASDGDAPLARQAGETRGALRHPDRHVAE